MSCKFLSVGLLFNRVSNNKNLGFQFILTNLTSLLYYFNLSQLPFVKDQEKTTAVPNVEGFFRSVVMMMLSELFRALQTTCETLDSYSYQQTFPLLVFSS
jgi:hypothetical protein